jgi:CRISPR-associated endonuclease Cas2
MSQHAAAHWLVTYDISAKRAWAQVYKRLKKAGTPIQYSMFFVPASAAQMARLMAELAPLIDAQTDDVRAYRLPPQGWKASLGTPMIAADLWLQGP